MTDRTYTLMSCALPERYEDDLAGALASLPILGCEIGSAEGGAVPVKVYMAHRGLCAQVRSALLSVGATRIDDRELAEQDWLEGYRRQTQPFAVGSLWWLDPHPDVPSAAPDGRTRLAIEPRMAFGTGSHESTQLMLLELEDLPVSGATVLDVGTGSGILALAALALDADMVVGLDIDPQAVWVARQVARQQERRHAPLFFVGPVDSIGMTSFRIVLCNMISAHFLGILPSLVRLLDDRGTVAFSGILEEQSEAVCAALGEAGLLLAGRRTLNEWVSLRAVIAA